jgi:hypothetical protein
MVSRFCLWLVELAARRWPDPDELAREWRAEVHELATQGRRGDMLRYSLSLAFSPPFIDRRTLATAAILLLAPLATVVLMTLSQFAMIIVNEDVLINFIGEWAFFASETARYEAVLAGAVLLAAVVWRAARLSPVHNPFALAVIVVIPSVPVLVFAASMGNMWRLDRAMPELLIWSLGLVLSLWLAASIPRRGLAWGVGLTGALLTAQAATMSVMTHVTTPVDWTASPMWLLSYFNYRGQLVNDVVSPMPEFYLMMTLYSLSFVLSAGSHVRARDVAEGHRRAKG